MLSKKDLSWLSVARAFARESELRKKHGAVVVRSGSVVGVGCNKHRNNPAYSGAYSSQMPQSSRQQEQEQLNMRLAYLEEEIQRLNAEKLRAESKQEAMQIHYAEEEARMHSACI